MGESELVIRRLCEISTESKQGLKHQINELLKLGCSRFNLEIGIVSKVIKDDYEILFKHCPAEIPLHAGDHYDLGDTYCSLTLASNGPISYEQVKDSDINMHPAYTTFRLESYVGVPIVVRDKVFGTLNFSSPSPMAREFKTVDIETLQLMAAWVGDQLSRSETEAELLQSRKMEAIGTLVSGIAHDFNNTLAAIQGNLFLAKDDSDDKAALYNKLGSIERLCDHAADVVRELLVFACKDMVVFKPLPFTSFAKEKFQLSKSIVPEIVDYSFNLCDEELIIYGDATQLHQVLLNLLINACDAVRNVDHPRIRCVLAKTIADAGLQQRLPAICGETVAKLTIEDNGNGISQSNLEHVFEPFFTTKEVGEGSGLGLSMVYGSVQTHGGAIDVVSESGKGTTVYIYLPLCTDESQVAHAPESEVVKGEGERVLLVDDDRVVLRVIKNVLISLGYHVLSAANGVEALGIFHNHFGEIDVIISDVAMPEMDGRALVQHVRKVKKHIPVILTTAYGDDRVSQSHEEIPHTRLIHKPISVEGLSQVIRDLLNS